MRNFHVNKFHLSTGFRWIKSLLVSSGNYFFYFAGKLHYKSPSFANFALTTPLKTYIFARNFLLLFKQIILNKKMFCWLGIIVSSEFRIYMFTFSQFNYGKAIKAEIFSKVPLNWFSVHLIFVLIQIANNKILPDSGNIIRRIEEAEKYLKFIEQIQQKIQVKHLFNNKLSKLIFNNSGKRINPKKKFSWKLFQK